MHGILPLANSNFTDGGVEALTTGAAVGIAVVTTAVVFFMAGVLTGALVYHCISKHRSQSSGSKPESSSHQLTAADRVRGGVYHQCRGED